MKNLIKKSIVLVVLFTALLGNANEISSLRSLNDEKTTMLTLLNVDKGDQLVLKRYSRKDSLQRENPSFGRIRERIRLYISS